MSRTQPAVRGILATGHRAAGTIRMAVDRVDMTRYTDEDPARPRRGPIGLQIDAGASEVRYRNLEIEVDPKEDRLLTLTLAPVPNPVPSPR